MYHYKMDTQFKKTLEWIKKTHENKRYEQEYYKKLKNKEDVSMFQMEQKRGWKSLLPKHQIVKYDDTLYQFIIETTQTIEKLNERIAELEKKVC